jgi:hypothetical protein
LFLYKTLLYKHRGGGIIVFATVLIVHLFGHRFDLSHKIEIEVTKVKEMERFRRILEISANILIVVAAIAFCVFLVDRYLSKGEQPTTARSAGQNAPQPGAKLNLGSVDLGTGQKNLVMVLSTSCRFCIESTGFYQMLSKRNAEGNQLKIIAAFPQEIPDSKKYLSDKGIIASEVIKVVPADLMVGGTPTLILINKEGAVEKSWVGKLPPEKEADVLEQLFGSI